MSLQTSMEFQSMKSTIIKINESNNNSQTSNSNNFKQGIFITPSEEVSNRPSDISGYHLIASNENGKLEWSKKLKSTLNDISDVSISSLNSGDCLMYNGTNWTNLEMTELGIRAINGLTTMSQSFDTGKLGKDFSIRSEGSFHTFHLPNSSKKSRGLLTSNDWISFNNKLDSAVIAINDQYDLAQTINIKTGDNLSIESLEGNHTINIPIASKKSQGILKSNDWIKFNNKLDKAVLSINRLRSKYHILETGTSGNNFNIISKDDTHTFNIPESSENSTGLLTSTDWTTFNNKLDNAILSINGIESSLQNFMISDEGNDFNIVSEDNTHTFNIPDSNTNSRGLLTPNDWNTFNNKLDNAILSINGMSGKVQFFSLENNGNDISIVSKNNRHVFNFPSSNSNCRGLLTPNDWNIFNNKLNDSLEDGCIFIGNDGKAESKIITGDAKLSNEGVITLVKSGVIAGDYKCPNIRVDSKGRIREISDGNGYETMKLKNGRILIGDIDGKAKEVSIYGDLNIDKSGKASLNRIIDNPGKFVNPIIDINKNGLITKIKNTISPIGKIITSTWNSREYVSPSMKGIAWSSKLHLFVTIGNDSPYISTSTDGIKWSARDVPEIRSYSNIIWVSELEIFVGISSNLIIISENGISWNSYGINEGLWKSITYSPELNLFCIVGNKGNIAISKDAIKWKKINYSELNNFESITWSSTLKMFAAVCTNNTHRVVISYNGTDWIGIKTGHQNNFKSIIWSPELHMFVAVSNNGTCRVITSNNGTRWKGIKNLSKGSWEDIHWCSDIHSFIAVGNKPGNEIITSQDGKVWTFRKCIEGEWKSICWSQEIGKFVVIGGKQSKYRIMSSLE